MNDCGNENSLDISKGAWGKLRALFGDAEVDKKCKRLLEIYSATEEAWNYNLENRLKEVKYILVAEAPPWPEKPKTQENLNIEYFYGANTCKKHPKLFNENKRNWLTTVWRAFNDELGNKDGKKTNEEMLKDLGSRGFLLIDTLPFAMDYSSKIEIDKKKKLPRKTEMYENLVLSCKDLLIEHLNKIYDKHVYFSPDVKVAFALKLNKNAVVKALEKDSAILKLRTDADVKDKVVEVKLDSITYVVYGGIIPGKLSDAFWPEKGQKKR